MSPNPMSRTPRNRRPVRRRAGFRRAATLAATTALLGGGVALSGPALAKLGAAATAVSLPGTFDSAIGCSGDWQPACAQAQMAVQADGRWKATLNLPAGSYSYKVAIRRRRQPTGGAYKASLPAGTWTKVLNTNGATSATDTSCDAQAVTVFIRH